MIAKELVCENCEIDTFSNETDAVSCLFCNDGEDTLGLTGQTFCTNCTENSFKNATMSQCEPCDKGFMTEGEGHFVCEPKSGVAVIAGGTVAGVAAVGGVAAGLWWFLGPAAAVV